MVKLNKKYLVSVTSYAMWGLLFSFLLITLDGNAITVKSIATSIALSIGFHYAFVWRAKRE